MKKWWIACTVLILVAVLTMPAMAGEAQPFKGRKITVSAGAGGRKAGVSGDLYEWREKWQELSGAELDIVEIPSGEHLEKIIVDNMTGTHRFDASIVGSFWYGALIAEDFIIPTEQWHNDPRMPKWPKDLMSGQERLYKWGGKWYGVPFDHDGQALYYRKDILNDPKWKAAFKKEKGYDLPVPPKTLDQLIDVSGFFNGKDWNGDGQPDSGIAMHLKVGGQGMYHFMTFSAPLTVLPGGKVDRYHNVYDFDPETMEPLVNDPGHVKALEMLIKLAKTGPDAQMGWSLREAWTHFLTGKAVFCFTWGDLGALAQQKDSVVKGKLGVGLMPGSYEIWDGSKKEFVKLKDINVVGNTTGGSWHGVIMKASKNQDVAYHLLAFHATKEVSQWAAATGWDARDPGRKSQFVKPYGEMEVSEYVKFDWDAEDAKAYSKAYHDVFSQKTMLPYLRIKGALEYWTALDRNLSEAMIGRMKPKEALDRCAKDWNETTERLGKKEQLKMYRESIGYTP